jgi:hypothetical protein
MRYILALCTFLFVGSLAAETIGNVEFQLPDQDWKVKHTLVTYAPENTSEDTAKSFFSASLNTLSSDLSDFDSLKEGLEMGAKYRFENSAVEVNILQKTSQSALYEWFISDSGQDKIFGLSRAILTPEGKVAFYYTTEDLSDIDNVRSQWIQTLENAKIIN